MCKYCEKSIYALSSFFHEGLIGMGRSLESGFVAALLDLEKKLELKLSAIKVNTDTKEMLIQRDYTCNNDALSYKIERQPLLK